MKALIKKISIVTTNPYLATFFGMSLTAFILGLFLFVVTYLLPGAIIAKAQESVRTTSRGNSILEVHIASNGMVFLQGAVVESIKDAIITVSTTWNETKLLWTIETDGVNYGKRHFGTSFLDSKGNNVSIDSIQVGDVLSINGTFDMTNTGLIVKAEFIRI